MSAAQIVALVGASLCFASFLWAGVRVFRHPGGSQLAIWAITLATGASVAAHLLALIAGFAVVPLRLAGGLGLYAASLALFWWALWTIRRQPLSYAFSADAPVHLVTAGPYRHIRHPLYSAYALAWIAGVVVTGEPWLLLTLVGMMVLYDRAARFEEAKFADSPLAAAYGAYCAGTGRFLPRLAGPRAGA
jgi:protein-S-isoprenylcysteine O-methyltransferase Ste14